MRVVEAEPIDQAIAEARRRAEVSDRDLSKSVAHFATVVRSLET